MGIMHAASPFDKWGIDIVGKLPMAPGGMCHLIVVVDYFSKWAEVEAVSKIEDLTIERFIWRNICCRYEAPFTLVYGSNAIVPVEARSTSHRIQTYSEKQNKELRKIELDMIDIEHELAQIRSAKYKSIVKAVHDKKVNLEKFERGDFVLKRAYVLKAVGKFEPNWEGPYIVSEVLKGGAYKLVDETGLPLPRPWNVNMLKRFFV
ncbi:uncharacterized protein LOC131008387 [Salvia miltiorrhiza]|uniref:uncharacterized protein LOC131008386 n=1 Tax=Salvia miltiorrhiza TaxID=226208 RepID=UPI0025AB8537|nr:uncharacterized protein LOC131008386 [Salvia miltiorrhiza]XP_057791254.1 uncharacterized protein LOC131008387 [Salvia miltiorrhiza]